MVIQELMDYDIQPKRFQNRYMSITNTLGLTFNPAKMAREAGYVFGNGNGGHIGDIKHSFTSACKKAGITDFRFHDLRHTYASHLAMRGVHIRALQELLGHKTLAMTQRYSHLAPEQLQNAVNGLSPVCFDSFRDKIYDRIMKDIKFSLITYFF